MVDKKTLTKIENAEFIVDGVLFDMDGTLVDSISAVESAWTSVANELGKDPEEVIAATHGRRAIDNLRDLKPELTKTPDNEMEPHVQEFETRILEQADAFQKEVRSRRQSIASSRSASRRASRSGSVTGTPRDSRPGSQPPSRKNSMSAGKSRQGSFASELSKRMLGMQITQLSMSSGPSTTSKDVTPDSGKESPVASTTSPNAEDDQVFYDDDDEEIDIDAIEVDTSDLTDASVKILPGVRRMINSIPWGKWCVATSGAKTYCHGALSRVGIPLPPVVVTADDPELTAGKPDPAPFILSAKRMGLDPKRCLVVEDSPSGIKAGVASGATVIAVATSHPVEKIQDCGQSYLVPTLDCVTVVPQADGRLKILIHEERTPEEPVENIKV